MNNRDNARAIWDSQDNTAELSDDELIEKREKLTDYFTPNGTDTDKLTELLEIERELTLREEQ